MPRINVLDKHTAELIAAGEVVERPASVIKELIENSIDAGATQITVEIKNGGNSYMRVTDNGCGIHKDDIRKAFLRHATSKIAVENDLNAINTLGFRGEALASVCAVARVEMLTRVPDSDLGMQYQIHGGEEILLDEAGCPTGTTIIVRDLFYNTPARLKFLKKDVTEGNAVASVVDRVALSHPEVSIKLIREGKETLLTPGDSNLKSAVYAVLGRDFSDAVLPVSYEMNGIKVEGFVSKPTAARPNRNLQFFYINGRFVKTRTAIAALEEAYKNAIMVGKFPSCVLNISLSAEEVDVNVHPAKIEVRFTNERPVFSAVYYAVKSAITADQTRVQIQTPSASVEPATPKVEQIKLDSFVSEKPVTSSTPVERIVLPPIGESVGKKPPKLSVSDYSEAYKTAYTPEPEVTEFRVELKTQSEPIPQKEKAEFKYIGQLLSTYILVECEDKLLLIDKHASHERIIFEELKAEIKHEGQMLLTPIQVTLSYDEYDALAASLDEINALGFEIEEFGAKKVLVRSLPMALDGEDAEELISEMAGKLKDNKHDISPAFLDWLYHSVACRAAIKAGNQSSDLELRSLSEKVLNSDNIRYCPHGRPTVIELTRHEIEKRFGRA